RRATLSAPRRCGLAKIGMAGHQRLGRANDVARPSRRAFIANGYHKRSWTASEAADDDHNVSDSGHATDLVRPSPWAPLRIGLFRWLWIASIVSNVGSWMHLVAASWLMTSLTSAAAPVALLSTAAALPSFALALPAGAFADMFDRRRLILITQTWQLV